MIRSFCLASLLAFSLTLALPAASQGLPDWASPGAVPTASSSDGFASLVPCPPGQIDDGAGGCVPNPPTQVPIDGGLGLLALAGSAYAARRLRRSR